MSTETMSQTAAVAAGTKRRADNNLDDEQRFTKRFNLLNIIDQSSRLYIPVSVEPDNLPHAAASASSPSPSAGNAEGMAIDDTPHRVYVHDLDAELASLPPDPAAADRLVFLPDIDRQLSRIPPHVLHRTTRDSEGKELVLYSAGDGSGHEGGADRDLVRRAIEETRSRKREAMAGRDRDKEKEQTWVGAGVAETAHGYGGEEWGQAGRRVDDGDRGEARRMGWGEIVDREEYEDDDDDDAMDLG